MSLRLILMRHAKSSWDDLSLSDHDRPLNARGRKSAKAVGDWLKSEGYVPDCALVSSAERTRETYERLGLGPEPRVLERLYHASEDRMLRLLKREGRGACVLMLGHNPGTAIFAEEIVQRAPEHPKFALFPTAAVLVVEFEADSWSEIAPRTGKVRDFIVPRALLPKDEAL